MRYVFVITILLLAQGCSTFTTCANIMDSDPYRLSTGYKAVASYFDTATLHPPQSGVNSTDVCWYRIGAYSQEIATIDVLKACNQGLMLEGKTIEWECQVIATGNELTEQEVRRIAAWDNRNFGRTRDTGPMGSRASTPEGFSPDRGIKQ